jgi:hypothetical protein
VYATGRSSRISGSSGMDRPQIAGQTVELIPAAGGEGEARRVGHQPGEVPDLIEHIEANHERLDVPVNDIYGGDRYAQSDKPLREHHLVGRPKSPRSRKGRLKASQERA